MVADIFSNLDPPTYFNAAVALNYKLIKAKVKYFPPWSYFTNRWNKFETFALQGFLKNDTWSAFELFNYTKTIQSYFEHMCTET